MTNATSRAGTPYTSVETEFIPVLWISCSSIFNFLCSASHIIFCPLAIVLSDLPRFMSSDDPRGIFSRFFNYCLAIE
jgi:hypothetical protein